MKLCWETMGSRVMCEGSPYKEAGNGTPQCQKKDKSDI